MLARVAFAPALAFGFLFLAGCGPAKLNASKTWDNLESGEARGIDLDAQTKPQTITVEFTSDSDVTALVFKKDDIKADEDMITADASKALAKSKRAKSDTFTADIPENTATRVVVRDGGKKTKVDLKVTNK